MKYFIIWPGPTNAHSSYSIEMYVDGCDLARKFYFSTSDKVFEVVVSNFYSKKKERVLSK
jgi:hypothetical protein